MDRMLYTAMSGAARTLEHQAVLTHNVANANTVGFRAQLAAYRSVPLEGAGAPTRVATVTATPGSDFSAGALQSTGRELDIAVAGAGWLALQTPQGEAYTRAGSLQVGSDGVLRNPQGLAVLSADGGPIEVPAGASLTFSNDGVITALGAGDPPNDVQALGQLKRVNPEPAQLERGDDGLFRLRPAADGTPAPAAAADASIGIVSGALESSNVSPVAAMVGMIDNARRFEMQMKAITQADGNAQRANELLSTSAG